MEMTYAQDPNGIALRRVKIRRQENGFGFTLRHFIVYPPDLYSKDEERSRNYLGKVTEPVDTIFVRNVVKNGPADRAGLCVGDRIVSVNGRTIFGSSYDTVVQLIQKSPDTLRLEVSPKQYDTLQLFFEETAYRPETNQRPYQSSVSGKTSLPDPSYYPGHPSSHIYYSSNDPIYGLPTNASTESFFIGNSSHYGSMSSSHQQPSSSSNPQLFSHLPRPTPYKSTPTQAWSGSGPPPQTARNLITSGKSNNKHQPQTYYPFNQELGAPPGPYGAPHLWKIKEEPNAGAKSAESILTSTACDTVEFPETFDPAHRSGSMECLNRVPGAQGEETHASGSWNPVRQGQRFMSYDEGRRPTSHRRESTGSIPNTNVPSAMVVTMSSTNSKMQSSYPPELSDSGSSLGGGGGEYETKIVDRIRRSCEQKEEFLRRPNQPYQPLTWAPLQNSSSSPFPKELYAQPQKFEKIPWPPAHLVPTLSSTKPPPIHSCHTNSGSFDSQVKNMNNVSVVDVQFRNRTTSPSNKSVDSSDCAPRSLSQGQSMPETGGFEPRSLSPSWLEYAPRNRTVIVGGKKLHCDPPPDWNPDLASLTQYKEESEDSLRELKAGSNAAEGSREVKLRVKNSDLDETERLVRRVSYLKATSSPIDMDRKSVSPTSPTTSPTSEYRGFGSLHGFRSPDTSEVIREGQIHYKIRLGESKKGGYNRSWRQGWAQIRRSGCLYISKEQLSRESVTITEDSVILALSLRSGVTVEQAEDYSKRKHVLRMKTSYSSLDIANIAENNFSNTSAHPPSHSTPVEILIQADDINDATSWMQCLQSQLENNNYCNGNGNAGNFKGIYFGPEFCPKPKSLLTSFLPSPATQGGEKGAGTSGHSLQPGLPNTPQSAASPKNKTWKGKVARQWKKVHNIIETSGDSKGSSQYSSMPPSGVTFGLNLDNCPPGERNPLIPRVIEYAVGVVEKRGIDMVGLYRIPGNNASVAALIERLNKGEDPDPEKDPKWLDVHVVASLIKSFLRRLPDPLLTDDRYQAFIIAVDDQDQEKCLERVQMLVKDLPDTNYETLRTIIMHLKRVAEHGESNRMDAKNLAIVFGPTIVRTAEENVTIMVQDMKNQCKIVELLISNAEELFKERRLKDDTGSTDILTLTSSTDELQSYSLSEAIRLPTATAVQIYNASTSDNTVPPPRLSPISPTIESELKASIVQAALRKVSKVQSQSSTESSPPNTGHNIYGLPSKPVKKGKPIDDAGFIRSYAGLNEETEQRVRKFELETRAMLSREDRSPHSSIINVGSKPLRMMNLEDELQRAKDDLENEDIYDQLADNPSSIIHHRDRGLFSVSSGQRNLSSSSISSSNSNGTIPSGYPPTQKLGPAPFRPTFPTQSLPPKPPHLLHNSGSSGLGPSSLQSKSSMSTSSSPTSPLRRVSSMDRFLSDKESQGSHEATVLDVSTSDTKLGGLSGLSPKHFGGSLDSLKDAQYNGSEGHRNGLSRREIPCVDFSPRSSEGSDLVTTLSLALDKKLEKLRSSNAGDDVSEDSVVTNGSSGKETVQAECDCEDAGHNQSDIKSTATGNRKPLSRSGSNKSRGGNGIKRSWRRFSLIERRVNGDVCNGNHDNKEYYRNPSLHRDSNNPNPADTQDEQQKLTKAAKTASNKFARDNRRRHSLSGGTDILSIAYHDQSIRYFDDPDPEDSSQGISTNITRAGILESHV